jgi:hypothetical protein
VQRRPSEGYAEPVSKQPVQRTRGQRAQPDPDEVELGPAQAERRLTLTCAALGEQETHGFLGQSPRYELEHERRRRVQPLHVVHRRKHGSLSGQLAKDA